MSIVYSKIRKHIIGKKSFWSFGVLALVFLIWGYFMYFIRDRIFFPISLGYFLIYSISGLLIMGISYNFINLYRCKRFYKFCKKFLPKSNVQFCKIMIEKKDYQIRSFREVIVHPPPKSTNAVYLETNEFILLFFSIQHFVLKEVLKPYIFIKSDKELYIKDKRVKIVQDFEITETEQGRAIVFFNKQGLKRVIIPAM
ncbi:MAG: hypothetical protein LBH22_08345 [Bacteroidales bacterium]|jgi:hypothetical protein|nr:hypothetical protein [Bacteroidales bacterium]